MKRKQSLREIDARARIASIWERNYSRFQRLTVVVQTSSTTMRIRCSRDQFVGSRTPFLDSTRKISPTSRKLSATRQRVHRSTQEFSSTAGDSDSMRS